MLDSLTDNGIIEDDSMIRDLRLTWAGIAKPGYVDVAIFPWKDDNAQ